MLKSTQSQNLAAIRFHISNTRLQWQEFQMQHGGYEKVHLFDYTGGDGMFGAYGEVPSEEHIAVLRRFMEGTLPPRPVYLGLVSAPEPKLFDLKKGKNSEPVVGATNGSRLIAIEEKPKLAAPLSRR